jgi:hypothetical protein
VANDLGRIQLHDPRSRDYAYKSTRQVSSSVTHRFDAPHVDQFYTSGCVGFSGANMLNCTAAYKSRKRFNEVNMRQRNLYLGNDQGIVNYHNATLNDPFDWTYPPTDNGSSAIGLMKWWKDRGIITRYQWAFGFDAFLQALETQPVLVGTNWYKSMMKPNKLGVVTIDGDLAGQHEYLASGFRRLNADNQYLIRFENSWGDGWGLGGRFYMMDGTFRTLLDEGGDVAIPRFL